MESALDYLLRNYFHQDFNLEFGNEWQALEAFLRHDAHLAPPVPAQIEELLVTHPSESALDDYLDSLGCEYRPTPEDGGYRGWLTEVARRVREATKSDRP